MTTNDEAGRAVDEAAVERAAKAILAVPMACRDVPDREAHARALAYAALAAASLAPQQEPVAAAPQEDRGHE